MNFIRFFFAILFISSLVVRAQYADEQDFYDAPESFVTDQESIIVKEKEDTMTANPYEHARLETSSDMAAYLHLAKIQKLRIGVPVNLLFIGFEGDGNHFLYFNDYEFFQYFEHVEHHLKHLVVPVGEEQTTTLKHETPATHIQFDIGWNIVKLHPLVNAIVEDTILWHLRPENNRPNVTKQGIPRQSRPDQKLEDQEFFYVDAFKFSTLLNNLLHYLNLTESYTVIIMNPKNPLQFPELQTYGYRSGFSDEEMRVLQLSENFMKKKILIKPPPKIRKHSQERFERKYVFGNTSPTKEGRGCLSMSDHYIDSENWAKWYLEQQKAANWTRNSCGGNKKKRGMEEQVEEGDERAEQVEARMSEDEREEDDWTCLFSERRSLHSGKKNVEEMAMELIENGTHFEQKYLSVIQESGMHVFNYSRLQLTNKIRNLGFQWDKEHANSTLNETEKAQKKTEALAELEKENIQEEMIWSMNAYGLHEDCLVDNWISHERFAFIDLTAGPFDWGPIVSGEGVRSRYSLPHVPQRTMNDVPHEAKSKATDLEVLRKAFWEMCVRYSHIQNATEECQALHNRVIQLHQEVHPIIKMNKEQLNQYLEGEAAQRGQHTKLSDDEVSAEEKNKVLQKFTSHLNHVISSSIRHLFVPPIPLYPPIYATRVIFNFFLITNHNSYNPFDPHHFNYEQFKQEVLKLKQPQQEFVFSLHRISLKRDRDLHVAFTNSLKHIVIPKLTIKGEFIPVTQTYLDTRELRHELQLKNITMGRHHYHTEDEALNEKEKNTKKTTKQSIKERLHNNDPLDHEMREEGEQIHQVYREIPIFFFSMSNYVPILVDKYYQSKALKDLVVVVQSRTRTIESRLACNGKVIYWNLANPMKSVLASVSLILGGLVPSHISYSEPRQAAEQNWLWSVGDNPFSYTSSKSHFSDTHKDLVARNYALHALEKSISKTNKVIEQLKSVSILETKAMLNKTEFQEKLGTFNILSHYTRLEHLWTGIVLALEKLHYAEAVQSIPELEDATKSFLLDCKNLVSELHILSCEMKGQTTKETSLLSHLDWWMVTCVLFDLVVVAVVLIIRGRNFKVKTN